MNKKRCNRLNRQATSLLSETISKDLKERGMKFLDSITITIYATFHAIEIVDDHEPQCFRF